jgi:ABC-type maltose transport system permease subunit
LVVGLQTFIIGTIKQRWGSFSAAIIGIISVEVYFLVVLKIIGNRFNKLCGKKLK